MKYKKFTTSQFICNEYFQNWIIHPDEESDQFWNTWLYENPEKKEIVDEAKRVLLNLSFKEDFPVNEQIQNALARNLIVIETLEREKKHRTFRLVSMQRLKYLRRIAAVFIGVILIATGVLIYNNWQNATITIATNYGEMKTIKLPDNTEIILNAHSSVTYAKHWNTRSIREVKLEGEAYFKVIHLNRNESDIKNSERFLVYTNDLSVEVLGTTFDVKNRSGKTDVILKSGKIKVAFTNNNHTDIFMHPGQMLTFEKSSNQVKRRNTDPVAQTAWIDKKMILENASVNTIIEFLRDNYGFKVILSDTAIGNKKMEGTLMLDNVKDILFILSTSLGIKIEKQDSTLIFKSNN